MEPMPNWARRVGCKKSAPNPTNSPPVKKKRKILAERIEDESQDNNTSFKRRLPLSHQEIVEETTSDLGNEGEEEATADTDSSAEGCDSDLQDMLLQEVTGKTHFSDGGGDSDLRDTPLKLDTAKTPFLPEGGASDLDDMSLQQNTAETHLSPEGGDSELQDASLQYDTAMTNSSGERCETYVPDAYLQYDADDKSNDFEETSEGVSPVNKRACQVCKDAEATIAVLPCRHLCLCMDCELECISCPVCGGPKEQQ